MKTSELFKDEIDLITNQNLKDIVAETLDASPECIQTIPASSTGKYHPTYALGNGGLSRHIKATVGIANDLMRSNNFRDIVLDANENENIEMLAIYRDVTFASLLLHDCKKPDDTAKHNTVFEHPLLAAKLFKEIAKKYVTSENMDYMKIVIPLIYGCIACHMGKWNVNKYNSNSPTLPEPKNDVEVFVHLCDYLASRKCLEYNFEVQGG